MEYIREVVISLDGDYFVTEFDQGDMPEEEFIEEVIDYVMRNIQIEVK